MKNYKLTNTKNNIHKILSIIVPGILFAAYLVLHMFVLSDVSYSINLKYILSIVGVLVFVFCIYNWYKITNNRLDLYIIFLTFFFLFNFGQCFMWSIGVHQQNEIGASLTHGRRLSDSSIILAQASTIICMALFHCGAVFGQSKNREKTNSICKIKREDDYKRNMSTFCILLLVIVAPITLFIQYEKYILSSKYGYLYLFDNNYSFGFLSLLSRLFFPCIYGLLISSDFRKRTIYMCYIMVCVYFVFSVLSGSRGAMIYDLSIMLFLHHRYIKKFSIKKIGIYFCIFIVALTSLSSIRSVRDSGMDFKKLTSAYNLSIDPIFESVFEMGGSMSIQGIVTQDGYNLYPYGNTYKLGLFSIISEKVVTFFNPEYVDLNTWFSSIYLNLDYGAGFTMVGEALLNFGPYIGPLTMVFFGWFIFKISTVFNRSSYRRAVFAIISFSSFIMFIRGTFGYYVKYWLSVIIMFYGLFFVYKIIIKNIAGAQNAQQKKYS